MKRIVAILFVLALMLCVCPLHVSANGPGPAESGETPANFIAIVLVILISVYGIVLTVVVEWLICKWFGMGKEYKKLIVWTNLATQIVLRVLQFHTIELMPPGISFIAWYFIYLAILESLVYLCEFLIYNWRMRNISWKKCLLYTVTANTASLIAGLLLLMILL